MCFAKCLGKMQVAKVIFYDMLVGFPLHTHYNCSVNCDDIVNFL